MARDIPAFRGPPLRVRGGDSPAHARAPRVAGCPQDAVLLLRVSRIRGTDAAVLRLHGDRASSGLASAYAPTLLVHSDEQQRQAEGTFRDEAGQENVREQLRSDPRSNEVHEAVPE